MLQKKKKKKGLVGRGLIVCSVSFWYLMNSINFQIYDSLLATPSVRTPPTSRSRRSSVSQHSATNRWRRSRVTLKYSETKCECWRSVLIYLLMFNTNTYKSIHSRLHDFSKDCLNDARQLEKISRKLARTRNHLRYNLTCYNSHLTPTGLSIRSNVRGPKAQFIIQKAERALVNERIRQHNFTVDVLVSEREKLLDRLQSKLTSNEFQEVARFSQNASQVENNRVKARHIEKSAFERAK